MRNHIVREIQRLAAANDGQPPGQVIFARETGIASHIWRGKLWARWGDALVEAGFQPNQWNGALDPEIILAGIIIACRHYGKLPTRDELKMYRQTDPSIPSDQAIKRHFGKRADLIAALAKRVGQDDSLSDVAAMLPKVQESTPNEPSQKAREGFVYLIKSGDFYKIGRGDDLERRVKQIRVALPDKATLEHSIRTDDPPGIEAYWHRRFAEKRANGEWFKLSHADLAAFKKRKFQ